MQKKRFGEDHAEETRKLFQTSSNRDVMTEADFIIEAVPEIESLKLDLFRGIVGSLSQNTILATNTSSISVTKLAAAVDRYAPQVIGMHFMVSL